MASAQKNHTILVVGGTHAERLAYAKNLLPHFLCEAPLGKSGCGSCNNCQRMSSLSHPNLFIIEPEVLENAEESHHATIKIDQIRRIINESHKTNFENGPALFLFTHMQKLTKAAANALLKALEEHSEKKIFIALAPSRMSVLPTITSRMTCHHIKPNVPDDALSDEIVHKITIISQTKPLQRFSLCNHLKSEREGLLKELEDLSLACHLLLRTDLFTPRFILLLLEALVEAEKRLKRNLNPKLVIERLLFNEWPFI